MTDATYTGDDSTKVLLGSNASSWASNPRQLAAYQFFVSKGWSPAQAAGIVGGLRGETENLSPAQSHDNGIGLGIAGWNGDRLAALRKFAQDRGASVTDLPTQLEFVHHELTGTESKAGDLLRNANDARGAGDAMLAYFRPANWDKSGAHPERARYAAQLYGTVTGDNAPVASMNALTQPANAQTNVSALLGANGPPAGMGDLAALQALRPPPSAAPTMPQTEFTPSQVQPIAPTSVPVVADLRAVRGPVAYPKFEVGKPLGVIDASGRQRTLHPVSYDPFGQETT